MFECTMSLNLNSIALSVSEWTPNRLNHGHISGQNAYKMSSVDNAIVAFYCAKGS